ncbi:hypothetical protein [Dokdonella fugitiva]|jgi:hypothetical protein|uniref:hypothetical protein n=1 Tax=Dokdonella fugitiva TaxID=328517 RepID=UPI0015FC3C27|nr:hypothetical protein [Dokdonella fugitiva]MBA8885411.1 hypothetical protein [Dokdonella fugitiva]
MNIPRTQSFPAALLLALAATPVLAGTPGIELTLTLSVDTTPGSCGDQSSLSVMTGTEVNYCYTLTNGTGETLAFVTAEQDDIGRFKILEPQTIAPGGTYRYNRTAPALESRTVQAHWTAFPVAPDYTMAQNDPDQVFGDGFDGDTGIPRYAFVDISGSGTPLAIDPSRNAAAPISIGFPFTYYGITADAVAAGINGGVLFGIDAGYLPYSPTPLPSTTLGPALLPWWDTFFQSPGTVYAQTLGEAPTRRFVVEWKDNVHFPATPDGATYELVLHEADGSIDFQYQDTSFGDAQYDHGLWATAGLNSGAQPARTYSRNAARLQDGLVVRFTPTAVASYAASASAELTVGKPIIQVTPAAISASANAGSTTTAMLAVGNIGTLPLGWGMGAAATGAPVRAASPRPGPLGASLPAYAFDQWPTDPPLVTFDVLHPDPIVPVFYGMRRIAAADFAGNDFGTLYAIDFWQEELLAVQTTDCACIDQFVHIGWTPPAPEEDWMGMHYDATSNRFWGVSFGGLQRRTSHLLRIDPATGASTVVGAIGGIDDPQYGTQVKTIAVSPEGLLYGIDSVTNSLITIDRNSARASVIGPLGFQVAGADMDFDDATGTLYLLAGDAAQQAESVYTVDTGTGHATPVDVVGPDGRSNGLSAFAIASLGPCNVRDAVPWLHWDVGGGSAMPGQANDVTLTLDATSLDAGTYTADLCIDNGDNAHPRVIVPVTFEVTAP